MSTANHYHDEEVLGKAYDARLMRRLMHYVRPHRWALVIAVLTLLVNAIMQTALAFLAKKGIDEHIIPGVEEGFGMIALAYLFLNLLLLGSTFGQVYITMLLGQNVQHDIRMQIFKHLQKLHLGFYDRNPVGRMVTRVTNDVNTLNEMFASGVVNIIGDVLMLVFYVAALFYVNWKLTLVIFMTLPALIWVTFVFRAKARDAYRTVRLKLARLNAFVQEHLTGINLIQLFTREKDVFGKFDNINSDLQSAHFKSVLYYAMFYPTIEIIGALSMGLLLYYGGMMIGQNSLSFGELFFFIYLVERFFHPIRDLSEKYNVLQASMASSERIFDLLDTEPAITNVPEPEQADKFSGKIEINNLWFAYKNEDWILKDVSFSIESGQKVAIVGATGAGKTSLVSLLYRFYDYQKGSIQLDGVDIKLWPVEKLRCHLGLVLQDVFLFSGDYAGNVRLREKNISDDDVRSALNRVGFDRFMDEATGGINTQVRERGATLSTGQKQLLSFARALAFDPDILILDEATSSVDSETEVLIQRALDELLRDRTSIIIAHRLSTVEKADKIVVLHHGEVREIGSHKELLARKDIYFKLYQVQYRRQSGTGGVSTSSVAQ